MNEYIFECENGSVYACAPPCCLICKKCTDIYWDYTNGPYMCMCKELYDNSNRDCDMFELDADAETVEEYEKRTGKVKQ